MSGNLEEITSSFNSVSEFFDIHCPENLMYPILRGGTCEHDLDLARCARRHGKIPSLYTGFRIAISEEERKLCPVSAFRVGGLSFATISRHENECLVLDLGNNKTGYCPYTSLPENESSVFIKSKKIGSEILVKIEKESGQLNNYICSKPHFTEFKNYLNV